MVPKGYFLPDENIDTACSSCCIRVRRHSGGKNSSEETTLHFAVQSFIQHLKREKLNELKFLLGNKRLSKVILKENHFQKDSINFQRYKSDLENQTFAIFVGSFSMKVF